MSTPICRGRRTTVIVEAAQVVFSRQYCRLVQPNTLFFHCFPRCVVCLLVTETGGLFFFLFCFVNTSIFVLLEASAIFKVSHSCDMLQTCDFQTVGRLTVRQARISTFTQPQPERTSTQIGNDGGDDSATSAFSDFPSFSDCHPCVPPGVCGSDRPSIQEGSDFKGSKLLFTNRPCVVVCRRARGELS